MGFVFFNAWKHVRFIHFPTVGCLEAEDQDNSVKCQCLAHVKKKTEARLFICLCGSWGSILPNSTQGENGSCCPLLKQNSPDPPSLSIQASTEEDAGSTQQRMETPTASYTMKLYLIITVIYNTCQNCRTISINCATMKKWGGEKRNGSFACTINWSPN